MTKPLKSIAALAGICLSLCWNFAPTAAAATITANSASYAHVSAAVASASNGDTVQVPAGSATWILTLNLGSKGIQLVGAGSGATIITNGIPNGLLPLIRSNNTGNNLVRVSGFRFNSQDTAKTIIHFAGPAHKVRVDHCYFNKGDCAVGTNQFWVQLGAGPVWGVVDHSQFYNMSRPYLSMDERVTDAAIGTPDSSNWGGATAWTEPILPGSDRMMVWEDNQFVWNSQLTNGLAQGALYGSGGGRCTFRYNTLTGNDAAVDAHGDFPDNSTVYFEIYNNTFNYGPHLAQGEAMWQRGGQWIVHDNTFNYPYPGVIKMSVFWSFDTEPHWVKNSYFWGNVANGNSNQAAIVSCKDSGQPGNDSCNRIRINEQYFLHPPTSGQVYFPYTPLVYPHPLVTGGGGPPPPTPSPSPTPPILGLTFNASAGVISTPFAVAGSAISQAVQTTDPTEGGRASYTFAVPTAGDYLLSALVTCPDGSSNSFFVNIDSEPTSAMLWTIPVTSGSETRVASWPPNTAQKAWTLTAGTHQLIFRGREANAILQRVTLGVAPAAPQGLHVP